MWSLDAGSNFTNYLETDDWKRKFPSTLRQAAEIARAY